MFKNSPKNKLKKSIFLSLAYAIPIGMPVNAKVKSGLSLIIVATIVKLSFKLKQ